ncbi:hypothetical protein MKW98_030945 [Papaver atlanticum]|uniref:Uncharacterized protein n=1 Tax=Papaver atlanticum TaxID=357466 RepID=A0AAD4S7G0_9MAGN|nr:hypothetical protein MKW98_030945 [Papaver atlanticum]
MRRRVQVYHQNFFKHEWLLQWNGFNGEGGCIRTKPLSYTTGSVQRASFVDLEISPLPHLSICFPSLPRPCKTHTYTKGTDGL